MLPLPSPSLEPNWCTYITTIQPKTIATFTTYTRPLRHYLATIKSHSCRIIKSEPPFKFVSFFSVLSWSQHRRSLIWPPICKTQEYNLHLHPHASPRAMAIDPRTVIVSSSIGGSQNQRHGSLHQPLICKTKEAGLHLCSHVQPAIWLPIHAPLKVAFDCYSDSDSDKPMPSSCTFISKNVCLCIYFF